MQIKLDVSDQIQKIVFDVLGGRRPSPDSISSTTSEKKRIETFEIGHPFSGFGFISFTIEGFGPHDGPNRIDLFGFTTLLEGKNGSGKSSMIYALNWCLTGKTGNMDPWSEEERSTDLINWNRKKERSMSVSLEAGRKDRSFTITRKLNDNGMEVTVLDRKGGKVDIASIGVEHSLLPIFFYQGESPMFLSMDGPFTGKGVLYEIIFSIVGGWDLEAAKDALAEIREDIVSRARSARVRSDRIEGRLEEIRKRRKEVEGELMNARKNMASLTAKKESSRRAYLEMIGNLPENGPDRDDNEERKTLVATRVGRLEERISNALSLASVQLLKSQGTRALNRAMERAREEDKKRMMSGALDAQLSIIKQVIDTRRCICGTPIGTTGMGKERLAHLAEKIEERKKIEARWEAGSIWSSEQFLWGARSDIISNEYHAEEVLGMIDSLVESRRTINRLETSVKGSNRNDIINAVRQMERARIFQHDEKKRISKLKMEADRLDGEISVLEEKMISIYGNRRGMEGLTDSISIIDRSVDFIDSRISDRVESIRNIIQERSTRILKEITRRSDIGITIHPGKMRIGRVQSNGNEERVVPITRLSAGERESVILSVVLGLTDSINSNLILDSPFSNMESGNVERALKYIAKKRDGILITVPEGSIPRMVIRKVQEEVTSLRRLELVRDENGSNIREVEK